MQSVGLMNFPKMGAKIQGKIPKKVVCFTKKVSKKLFFSPKKYRYFSKISFFFTKKVYENSFQNQKNMPLTKKIKSLGRPLLVNDVDDREEEVWRCSSRPQSSQLGWDGAEQASQLRTVFVNITIIGRFLSQCETMNRQADDRSRHQ